MKIEVTKKQLEEIRDCLNGHHGIDSGDFCVAMYYGFVGFAGGLDHVEETATSIRLVNRGVSSGGRNCGNTTTFVAA